LLSVLIQMRYTTKLILLHAYTFLVPVWEIWWVRWQFKNLHLIGWLWCTGNLNILIAQLSNS
jgi:hypothetical protein